MPAPLPTPTSELQAVNVLLGTIGESPVNSLGGDQNVDVSIARKTLLEVSQEIQAEGWHFNTETEYPLAPNQDSNIVVPPNAIRVDADTLSSKDVVLRGTKLYDKKAHSFTFTETIKVEIVFLLPFEELPESARRFITVRAARIFQDRLVGSEALHEFNADDEARARALMKVEEGDTADHTIFDNYQSAQILYRGPQRRYF